ncbi:MAG: Tad domain-containing protein [Anaerolineaceae bacterium]|nr:Tad domain-containing protein [Anaerolineaceae bacterium]
MSTGEIKFKKEERGQVLIIMVLASVMLLAFTGLAIDGSMLLTEKRQSQNMADLSAISAARAICEGENANSAIQNIALNNYGSLDFMDNISVNQPPISGPYTGLADYIEVVITTEMAPGLISSVYGDTLRTTSRAVAHCDPGGTGEGTMVGGGNAIIALEPSDENGLWSTGNGGILVKKGGIFVNSNNRYAAWVSGNGDISADAIYVVGSALKTGNGNFDPLPTTGVAPMTDPLASLTPPAEQSGTCIIYQQSGNTNRTIDPGSYCSIHVSGNGDLTMNPGTYYLTGSIQLTGNSDLVANGASIIMQSGNFKMTGNGDLHANPFFLYLKTGNLMLTGNGDLDIAAKMDGDYPGLGIYLHPSNTSGIDLTGNGDLDLTGTIYAPASSVFIRGNGDASLIYSQFIAKDFKVSGNGRLTINYDPAYLYSLPSSPFIEMVE